MQRSNQLNQVIFKCEKDEWFFHNITRIYAKIFLKKKEKKEKKKKRIYAKRNHEYQPYFGLQDPLTKILELLGKTSLLKVKSLNFLSKQFFETL